MRLEIQNDTGKRSLGLEDATGNESWNAGIVPESEPRRAGRVSGLFCFLFSFSTVLSPGRWRSSQSRLVEEFGPVSVVRFGTADLHQNVVHR